MVTNSPGAPAPPMEFKRCQACEVRREGDPSSVPCDSCVHNRQMISDAIAFRNQAEQEIAELDTKATDLDLLNDKLAARLETNQNLAKAATDRADRWQRAGGCLLNTVSELKGLLESTETENAFLKERG